MMPIRAWRETIRDSSSEESEAAICMRRTPYDDIESSVASVNGAKSLKLQFLSAGDHLKREPSTSMGRLCD